MFSEASSSVARECGMPAGSRDSFSMLVRSSTSLRSSTSPERMSIRPRSGASPSWRNTDGRDTSASTSSTV